MPASTFREVHVFQRFSSFVALLLWLAGAAFLATPCARAQDTGLEPLAIATASGSQPFSVEVMRTNAEREKGLMFRRFLPQDRGMLFDFKVEQDVLMWMKNTYIPLDMVFISRSGKVVGIAENAEPLSERIIPSGAPCYGVLEVNAGTVARIGVKIGDIVHHPMFGT